MRSLLFVPADSPRKFEKALASGADALILDLEDSVAATAKAAARTLAREALARAATHPGAPKIFVRINALDTGLADADLDAVMQASPFGIVLPKASGGVDVQHLSAKLAVREAENGLTDGAALILPIATETGASMFGLGTYAGSSRRLAALTWGAEDLSADLGTETNREPLSEGFMGVMRLSNATPNATGAALMRASLRWRARQDSGIVLCGSGTTPPDKLLPLDLQIDAIDGSEAAELLGKALCLQDGVCHPGRLLHVGLRKAWRRVA